MSGPGAARGQPPSLDERRAGRSLPVLPLLLVALVALAFLLRPQQMVSTLTSPRAWLFVIGVLLVTRLHSRVTRAMPAPAGTAVTLLPVWCEAFSVPIAAATLG